MPSKALLRDALNDAFRAHFVKIFGILMGEPTKEQYQRFLKGFQNSVKAHDKFEKEIIETWEQ